MTLSPIQLRQFLADDVAVEIEAGGGDPLAPRRLEVHDPAAIPPAPPRRAPLP